MMKGFQGLKCWQCSSKLRQEVYQLVKTFPSEEKYRLSDQLIRSTRSVGNSIAEGYGRYNYQDNIRFCRIGRGSLEESHDHLIIALECKLISQEQLRLYESKITEIKALINGYIAYLSTRKANDL